ncbi:MULTISPECIES: hypothetical protein [Paenibacillus]|uniref:Phage protein n=1 Tax=Paenibacillus cucumis (ex Kampfer et al. 2016) TaxID=1776858 RepID=A0ABS7KEW4_9BACL|nr:hypothetical protein [Paenibacillus cucumis (ex Kampfer et al. 2016)]MBY0202667.1 hypothetical protein [Paenibacillus cucumis (ex Kampfer et al. 2016)]MDP9700305.1 hypothetical protein [Paenibacillus intestini]
MLNVEQKLEILESYPQLQRKNVSLGRVNFHYEDSAYEKKIVALHIHPNGNGYIYAGLLPNYETDAKGFVNVRDYSEADLRTLLDATLEAMSHNPDAVEVTENVPPPKESAPVILSSSGGIWINEEGHTLTLKYDNDMWCVYADSELEMAFESRGEAGEYLEEEGFKPQAHA